MRNLTSIQPSFQTELTRYTLNPMSRINILHQRDLVARSASLARDDGAVGEEILPYLISPNARQSA